MKYFISYILLAYCALAVQSLFFSGVKPDLVLVLVCAYSLKFGQTRGVIYGMAAGLLVDVSGGLILGPNLIGKSVVAFLIRSLRENLFQWNIYVNTIMIVMLSGIDIFLVYACFEFFSKVSFVNRPWLIPITQVFYTAAASIMLYHFLQPGKDYTLIKEEGF